MEARIGGSDAPDRVLGDNEGLLVATPETDSGHVHAARNRRAENGGNLPGFEHYAQQP